MNKTNKKKVSDLSDAQLKQAKQAYMEYKSVAEIADALGVARTSLSYHVNKSWKVEREMFKDELMQHFASNKRAHFVNISENAIKVLSRALQDLATREIPPSTREAKDAAGIIEALDKILRLDDGKPTDIIANEKPVSIIEIKERLKIDPFYGEIEDAEFSEEPSDN